MTDAGYVMIVDDDEALLESTCELLQEDGFRAVGVDNGAVALSKLRADAEKPDVILLDLMMPVMSGWQFRVEQLRDPVLAPIPVVIMTASRDVQGIEAHDIVYKPIKLEKLLAVIRRYIAPAANRNVSAPESEIVPGEGRSEPARRSPDRTDAALRAIFASDGEMGSRMCALDWTATSLGVPHDWPQSLRSALSICLGSRFPIALYWGPTLALLYNDAWSTLLGTKHPQALGQPGRQVWPEIWDTIGPMFDQVMSMGESTYSEDAFLPIHRHGYTEECYFNFSFSPIRGEGGRVEGIFNAVIETTFRVISERRNLLLRELGERTAHARSVDDACAQAAITLAAATRDVPFSAFYLVADDGRTARLAACAGLPRGGPGAPERIVLEAGEGSWPLARVQASGRLETVTDIERRIGLRARGGEWPEPVQAALLAPLHVGDIVSGFLVLGVNPRRAIDEDYAQFAERMASLVASSMMNANAYDAERKRAEALTELDRAKAAFFNNVSHQLRTPLTLMLGPTEELLAGVHGELAPAQRRQLELLYRNGLRLQKLVKTLLDFTRLEAGRTQASYEPTDLSALTRELTEAFLFAVEPSSAPAPGADAISEAPTARSAGTSGRVLVVDDNADMRDYLRRNLEAHWEVETAEDGARALAIAHLHPPDLILTSVMMPRLDGFALLRELKQDEKTRLIPVLILLARADDDARIEGLQAGADDYLVKPFSARELVARVRIHLEAAQLRHAAISERDRLHSLLGQAPAIINFLRGPELIFEYAHPWAVRAVGGRELIGKPLLEAIPELREQEYPALLRRVLETGEHVEGREMLARLDTDGSGQLRDTFWSFVYLPVRSQLGHVEGVMTFDVDVTDHVLARRQIQQSEEKFRGIVNQLQAGIAQTDLTGRFTVVDERYCEIVGRSEAELLELQIQEITHPDDLPTCVKDFEQLTRHGAPFALEKRYVKPDGSTVWVQKSVSRIEDRDGRPQGATVVTIDITQRKYDELALRESEERFRNMADHAPVMVWVTEEDGRRVYQSQSWYDFTGHTPVTGLGFGWIDALHPDDRQRSHEAFVAATARREPFQLEYRVRRRDGEYRYAIDSASPRINARGEFLGYIGSTMDITERRALEEDFRLTAERLVIAQEAATIGTFDWWPQGGRHFWSPELYRLLGVEGTRPLSFDDWKDRMHPEDVAHVWPEYQRALAERRLSLTLEYRMRLPSGKFRWLRLAQQHHYDAAGNLSRMVGAAVDIHRLKDALESERAAREEAERASRFSEMFVGMLGHDLRNPLSAITTAASLLQTRAESERIAKPVARIIASADRMERMISQLLDFTHIRIGHGLPLERERVDFAELVRATIEELQPVYSREMLFETVGDAVGTWDRDRLSQLLSNLVANACQHGTPGTPVLIQLDGSHPDAVHVEIRNRGAIAPDLLPLVFDPLPPSGDRHKRRDGSSGLGLGLYITQQVVVAHGGSIRVESDEAHGTRFIVELPRSLELDTELAFGFAPPGGDSSR